MNLDTIGGTCRSVANGGTGLSRLFGIMSISIFDIITIVNAFVGSREKAYKVIDLSGQI